MKNPKQVLRLLGLVVFIVLASFGLGLTVLPSYRERYMNNEIRTEQVDKRKEDDKELDEKKV